MKSALPVSLFVMASTFLVGCGDYMAVKKPAATEAPSAGPAPQASSEKPSTASELEKFLSGLKARDQKTALVPKANLQSLANEWAEQKIRVPEAQALYLYLVDLKESPTGDVADVYSLEPVEALRMTQFILSTQVSSGHFRNTVRFFNVLQKRDETYLFPTLRDNVFLALKVLLLNPTLDIEKLKMNYAAKLEEVDYAGEPSLSEEDALRAALEGMGVRL